MGGEDPQAGTRTNIMITRHGMRNNLQEEEEEARNGKKIHGENTKCNKEVVETPQTIEVKDIVMWGNTIPQTMVMAQGRGREVLAQEDIRTETTVREMIKKEEEVTEISAQEKEET